jgi:hypothetical protein
MKPTPNLIVERFRIRDGQLASSRHDGNNGMFVVPMNGLRFAVMVSDGAGWDHVSISLPDRCPTWDEMCAIKDMWFHPEECVVQYHPPRSVYRNACVYCLHLWRPQDAPLPMPSPDMVA